MQTNRIPTLLATLTTAGLLTAPAAADGPEITYGGPDSYKYWLWLLPDIDQSRSGLPNNGNNHCVPTAVLNACAYAGNHGFEDEVLCENVWALYYQWPPFYEDVTELVLGMGVAMNTDPNNGTTGQNGIAGAKWAMSGGFLCLRYARNSGYWPRFDDLAEFALNGALVVPIVGWYEDELVTQREGGHALTLHNLKRSGDNRVLGVCDPASADGDLFAQSAFTHENYAIQTEIHFVGGVPWPTDRLVGLGSGSNIALLDAFYAFVPLHAYSWDGKSGLIDYQSPNSWVEVQQVAFVSPAAILDIALDAATNKLYAMQPGVDGLINIVKKSVAHGTEDIVLQAVGIQDIEMSRWRNLYVLAHGEQLSCYRVTREGLELEAQRNAPVPIDAITIDVLSDEMLAFSGEAARLLAYPADLNGRAPEVFDIDIEVGPREAVSLAIDPSNGIVWLAAAGLEHFVGFDRRSETHLYVEHPLIENITSLAVTPRGNLLFGDGSETHEITPEGVLVRDDKWTNMGGGHVFFPTSVDNFDPDTMEGPRWRNELPTRHADPVPFCIADLDESGSVGTRDLLTLLARWGTDDLAADLDGNGVVDTSDLIRLLANWGRCEE